MPPALQAGLGLQSGLVFLVLLLAIPVQYYLSSQASVPQAQRQAIFQRLISSAHKLHANYLSVSSWKRWCISLIENGWRTSIYAFMTESDDMGESPAIEVFEYQNPEGYFGTSTLVRSPRPEVVKFRVGQVVKHTREGYRGVIVGWDPEAHAPEAWLREMHPPHKKHWRQQPNYAILVDTRDIGGGQMTYVPQESLTVIKDFEVRHPHVYDYFDMFDGAIYIMRPAIKELYPHD